MKNDPEITKVLLQTGPRLFDQFIGAACTCCGLALGAFTIMLAGPFFRSPSFDVFVMVSICSLLTCLLLTAGMRLLLSQTGRHGSLLPPWVWYCISATMAATAGILCLEFLQAPTFRDALPIASALLLAVLAFIAGDLFQERARRKIRE